MVDEPETESALTSEATWRPQGEHESFPPSERGNKQKSQSEANRIHVDNLLSKNLCQKPNRLFRSPSSHGRRNCENETSSWYHQPEHAVSYDSSILSPIVIERQTHGTEPVPIRKHKDGKRRNELNFSSSLTPSAGFGGKTKTDKGDLNASKARPEPLVLDPSARNQPGHLGVCNSEHRRVFLSSKTSTHLADRESRNSTVKKIFQVATKGIREHHATAAQCSTPDGSSLTSSDNARRYLHVTPVAMDLVHGSTNSSAGDFARSKGVVQAGFLQKLGKNIPEYKRRFFILKPETALYYYLSPHDTEPRGKIDLEGSTIKEVGSTPDGRFRFSIFLAKKDCGAEGNQCTIEGTDEVSNEKNSMMKAHQQKQENIILEARSEKIGQKWIEHMKEERVSFLKENSGTLNCRIAKQTNQIANLEKQIQHFRMIESDRDGALEDAENWKKKFNRLDEALRLLTQRIRKSLACSFAQEKNDLKGGGFVNYTIKSETSNVEKKIVGFTDIDFPNADDAILHSNSKQTSTKGNSVSSLLDDLVHEDMDVEEIMDVPGTYFSGLSNAFKQQKESSRLASLEASAAVEDVIEANKQVEAIQKRMQKAEKQILKLWEENCVIRKKLKEKKREKRVLVKEVKQLQHTVKELRRSIKQSSEGVLGKNKPLNESVLMADTMIGSDEERLIIELEEHVASSIRLHERLLAGTDFDCDTEQSISTEPVSINIDENDAVLNYGYSKLQHGVMETSKSKLLSLFDDKSDSEESSVLQQNIQNQDSCNEIHSVLESVVSLTSNMTFGHAQETVDSGKHSLVETDDVSSHRINPLLELTDEEDEEILEQKSVKLLSSKLVTENGQATSRLVCPLADVIDVGGLSVNGNGVDVVGREENEDLRVQHLTFYSQKIGIQFQRASPTPLTTRGLITDAVRADLTEEADCRYNIATELNSILMITSLGKKEVDGRAKELNGTFAMPKDIVLVCGFEGFDDSGLKQRPKLGARLVAFDGVSVEVGKWTFDSIRKAIKSRRRPLTLSFRNDFLTTEQRETLTNAIKDVDSNRAYDHHFYTEGKHLDISMVATEESNCWNRFPSSAGSSISSDFKDTHTDRIVAPPSSASSKGSTHKNSNGGPISLYSTSDVGSSGAVSSLMNILGKKVSKSSVIQPGSQPIGGNSDSIEERLEQNRWFDIGKNPSKIRQHQDFRANLL